MVNRGIFLDSGKAAAGLIMYMGAGRAIRGGDVGTGGVVVDFPISVGVCTAMVAGGTLRWGGIAAGLVMHMGAGGFIRRPPFVFRNSCYNTPPVPASWTGPYTGRGTPP